MGIEHEIKEALDNLADGMGPGGPFQAVLTLHHAGTGWTLANIEWKSADKTQAQSYKSKVNGCWDWALKRFQKVRRYEFVSGGGIQVVIEAFTEPGKRNFCVTGSTELEAFENLRRLAGGVVE